tara:strand:- start:23156 stop:24178 length:1023 start_codon:yes stop_codon:yes gene_type:complete
MKFFLAFFLCLVINNICKAQTSQSEDINRIYKNVFIEKGFYDPEEFDLYRPDVFTYDSDLEEHFIYDYSQKNLYQISLKSYRSNQYTKLGNGNGSGPGEFRNPTDICIGNTSKGKKLVVIDSDLSRVSIWDLDKNIFESSFKPKKFNPFRLACTNTDIIIYNSLGSKKGDYLVFDYNGNELSSFKDPQENKNTFLDSGYIDADSEHIYYSSQGRPILKKINRIDKKFESKLFIEPTVGENKTSKKTEGDYIIEKRDKDFIYQSRGIGLFEDFIVVLYSGRKDAFGNVLDFYNKTTLKYNFSSKIDLYSQFMSLSNNILLVRGCDQELKKTIFKFYSIEMN